MITAMWILIYILSVVASWFLVRAWLKFGDMEGSFIFVAIVFAPGINLFAPIMFMGFLGIDWLMNKEIKLKINYNKFFKL